MQWRLSQQGNTFLLGRLVYQPVTLNVLSSPTMSVIAISQYLPPIGIAPDSEPRGALHRLVTSGAFLGPIRRTDR